MKFKLKLKSNDVIAGIKKLKNEIKELKNELKMLKVKHQLQ
jgi:alanyl-tRNA synthetase